MDISLFFSENPADAIAIDEPIIKNKTRISVKITNSFTIFRLYLV
jgi:hypothetical protein